MLQSETFEDNVMDFAECAVCWSDTRLRCGDCGDPVCDNCQACPNGCDKKPRPSIGLWEMAPFVIPAA